MNRVTAIIAVAALFVAGISIGALGMQVLGRPDARDDRPPPPPPPHRMLDRLGLDDDQRRKLEAILDDSRREGDAIREELRPRVEELMSRTRERMAEVLTPEQLERFDRMQERGGGPHRRFMLGDRPPRPPRPRARTSEGRGAGSGRRNGD